MDALRDVIDPELGINIVDLGLVYEVEVGDGSARIVMTVTSPICPMKPYLVEMARREVRSSVEDVESVEVVLAREPPWSPEMMSDEARRQLGWDRR